MPNEIVEYFNLELLLEIVSENASSDTNPIGWLALRLNGAE